MVTNSSSFLHDKNWNDLFLLDQQLDMDAFLQSNLLAAKFNAYMKVSIANMTTGSISFIASILLVTHILRSHECLCSTYHRLIFGLSVADIISSFGIALSSTMTPKEISYLVPFASGNAATCDAQGFLIHFPVFVSACYNCCICFYYLAIISYSKRYDYIQRKLEPWFHGISILFPLVINVILVATDSFNAFNGSFCFPQPHNPPHCIGHEAGDIPKGYSITCGRGGVEDGLAKLRTISRSVQYLVVLIIAPLIIVVTMAIMFKSVSNIEKKMQKYGVGSLRLRTTMVAQAANINPHHEARGFAGKMKKLSKYLCLKTDASQTNRRCFRRPCASDAGRYDPKRLT
jgi:hypothetical protein